MVSKVDLVLSRLAIFPLALTSHIYRRVWARIHTIGISDESSELNCNLPSLAAVAVWSRSLTKESNQVPTSLVLTQANKQCGRSAVLSVGQSRQFSDELERILLSLASVGSRL